MNFNLVSLTHFIASIFAIGILVDLWFFYSKQDIFATKVKLDHSIRLFSVALALWAINDLFTLIDLNSDTLDAFSDIIATVASSLNNCAFLLTVVYFDYAPESLKRPSGQRLYQRIVWMSTCIILLVVLVLTQLKMPEAAAVIDICFSSLTLIILSILLTFTFLKRGFIGIGMIAAIACNIAVLGQILINNSIIDNTPKYYLTLGNAFTQTNNCSGKTTLELKDHHNYTFEFEITSNENSNNYLCISTQRVVQAGQDTANLPVIFTTFDIINENAGQKTDFGNFADAHFKLENPKNRFSVNFISPQKIEIESYKPGPVFGIGQVLYLVSFFLIVMLFVALAFSWILATSSSKTEDIQEALRLLLKKIPENTTQNLISEWTSSAIRPDFMFIIAEAKKPLDKQQVDEYKKELRAIERQYTDVLIRRKRGEIDDKMVERECQQIRQDIAQIFNRFNP